MNKGLKIAVSGKGGVGKSTLAGALALLMARQGCRVLAVDADPDANLGAALGVSASEQAKIVPISEQVALIEERTGAKVSQYGQMFKLNPDVADIADGYATMLNGVALLVLGAVEQGGGGCACPESVLLRALITDLILYKDDALILDMEAGVEHLGRATARGVDTMVVVVEPGQRSLDCARRVKRMAGQIGLTNLCVVGNKITSPEDEAFIRENLPEMDYIGSIPFSETIRQADRSGVSVIQNLKAEELEPFEAILSTLKQRASS